MTASTPGCAAPDPLLLDAEAARDDHAAVFRHGFADGVEAFLLGRVEEAAGIDHHDVGAGIVARQLIALGAQLGDDAFAIDQRLGAAERHKPHARRSALLRRAGFRHGSGRLRMFRHGRGL